MEMASENQVTIVGNLTDDPELRYTPNGAAVVKFRVAVNRRVQGRVGQLEGRRHVVLHGQRLADRWRRTVAESLTRGTRVVVVGRLQMRSWETQDGDKRTVVEIEADEIGPSLRWATAKVERQGRSARLERLDARHGRRSHGRRGDTTGCHLRRRSDPPSEEKDDKGWQKKQKRKVCIFCKDRIEYVDYKDTAHAAASSCPSAARSAPAG